MLVAVAVTLAAGLTAAFGVRRFAVALLLDLWLIVASGPHRAQRLVRA